MANTLSLANFNSPNIIAQTKLTADVLPGDTTVQVTNNTPFTNGGPALLGNIGDETAEITQASISGAGTEINLNPAATLAHNNGATVTLLFGDQLRVYSAPDTSGGIGVQPTDDQFSSISSVSINPTNVSTMFTDDSGEPGTWYKYTYFNSGTNSETSLSSSRAVQVGAIHYVSLDEIRSAAGFSDSPNVSNDTIARFRDAAENEINGVLLPVYEFPLPQPTNPIVSNIAKDLAAGMLMEEEYLTISPSMAGAGTNKADKARNGGGRITSLSELSDRSVVLLDAKFRELTVDEGHGFGGWPDETTQNLSKSAGGDHGVQFTVDQVY